MDDAPMETSPSSLKVPMDFQAWDMVLLLG